jgi:prophage regulatory protein
MQVQKPIAIRFPELKKKVPASRSTIFRWEKQGLFPRHFSLGKNSVAWLLSDVEKWLLDRAKGGNQNEI